MAKYDPVMSGPEKNLRDGEMLYTLYPNQEVQVYGLSSEKKPKFKTLILPLMARVVCI